MVIRRVAIMALVAVGCSSPTPTITIHAPAELAPGTVMAVDDLRQDLRRFAGREVLDATTTVSHCVDGETHLVVLGHEHGRDGAPAVTELDPQAYTIDETRCDDDGHLVILRGGSLLAAQWAIYDLLEHLGVRYFHPEQTLYPESLVWPAAPLAIHEQPAFAHRSLHLHRVHPIELSPPLDASPAESAAYQRRWIAWNVKLRHSDVDGFDDSLVGSYPYDRGFPRQTGLNLLETQQGGRPVIDPDDPRPESVQIALAIDAAMAPVPGLPPVTIFIVLFNPSEFTVAPEQATIDRLTFVTTYIHDRWPGVDIRTINHGTAESPGPEFGVRFFDLPQFAPRELGVEVHPLMFYDLDRPAPVYGNQDFHGLRDWILSEQAARPIIYYPESSWWLTFDLPVPLFLAPVSLEARDHDLRLLAPYVVGEQHAPHGVVGHKAFSSGQEWGYWLIDYCTARMTWSLEEGWVGCLEHVASAFTGSAELSALLVEVGRAQVEPMRDPDLLAMLVGSDDSTETAELAGVHFHPLPPTPSAVLGWDETRAATFRARSLEPLVPMAAQYRGWADRADALVTAQSDVHASWVRELADGLRITGLRAEHAHATYATALALRTAIAARDFAGVDAAGERVADVQAITTAARAIVTAREAAYRYPLALSIAGDEPGTSTAVPNATIYPYRYLSRTHRMFYWTRPDTQTSAMFGFDVVKVNDRLLLDGTALDVQLLATGVSELTVAWGDGDTATTLSPHHYLGQGVYDWRLDALHSLGAVSHPDRVAIVGRLFTFAKGSLAISEPHGASILEGLLPGFEIGLGADGAGEFLALGQLDQQPPVELGSVQRRARVGASTVPSDLSLNLKTVGAITVFGAVFTIDDGTGLADRQLSITGELSTEEVVQLVARSGGFDEAGARDIVASTLGYTAVTLPTRLPFRIAATGSEQLP